MTKFKEQKGITLVALIITIIVLLILATVSINLVINSEMVKKAEKGTNQFIEEQIKIAYSDYQAAQFKENDVTLAEFVESSLKNDFKNDNIKSVTTNEDEIIVTTIVANNDKVYVYNIKTGIAQEKID